MYGQVQEWTNDDLSQTRHQNIRPDSKIVPRHHGSTTHFFILKFFIPTLPILPCEKYIPYSSIKKTFCSSHPSLLFKFFGPTSLGTSPFNFCIILVLFTHLTPLNFKHYYVTVIRSATEKRWTLLGIKIISWTPYSAQDMPALFFHTLFLHPLLIPLPLSEPLYSSAPNVFLNVF